MEPINSFATDLWRPRRAIGCGVNEYHRLNPGWSFIVMTCSHQSLLTIRLRNHYPVQFELPTITQVDSFSLLAVDWVCMTEAMDVEAESV